MKLWFDELGMNSWIIVLMMFENMLLMNWYDEYAIGELMMKVLLMLNNFEILVKFWIETKWCLIHEFWAFLCMCLCTWPINFIWDEFWVWEDQNWSVWKKGFWNSKFFFWTDECSLKRTPSEPQANVPSSFLDAARLSEPWAKRKRTQM